MSPFTLCCAKRRPSRFSRWWSKNWWIIRESLLVFCAGLVMMALLYAFLVIMFGLGDVPVK